MPWQDRILIASYTSPGGTRLEFTYENLSKSFDKKTAAFNFPDAQGTYIQDLGNTGRRYPLRVIFWGDDHDTQANAFELLLNESGVGVLEHPIYGQVDVVPFGSISFRNDLQSAANQTIIDVTFWQTIGIVFPLEQDDAASSITQSVSETNTATAQTLEQTLDIDSEVEKSTFKSGYQSLLSSVSSGLESIASAEDDVLKQFNAANDSINNGIDILISDPLTLAFQTSILIQAPARASSAITARLDAYKNLARSITGSTNAVATPSNNSQAANDFQTQDLYALTYVTGMVLSVLNNQFSTKLDALGAADLLAEQMEEVTNWRDENYLSLSLIDTGESYQKLNDAFAVTIGFLVALSFTLKQERRIFLDRPRTVIDFIAEFYPADVVIDDEIDFFIQSNDLTGDEIIELPRGRGVFDYV